MTRDRVTSWLALVLIVIALISGCTTYLDKKTPPGTVSPPTPSTAVVQ
jgi:uncharacterized protein YceK